jgi:hypothetical protein
MKMKFGAIVVAGSGKIGGHVASKNRSGAYLRTKVTPTNPNTASQALSRSILASLATAWSGLTEIERLGWNAAVKDFGSTDIFGDIKNPSGINLFIKLNANLANSGQATITSAPAKTEVAFSPIESVIFNGTTTTLTTITFADAGFAGVKVLVSATPKVSQGTTFVKNLMRNIGVYTVVSDEIDYYGDYVTKFGIPAEGEKFYIAVEPVMPNGQKGTKQSAMVIVNNV